MADQAFVHHEPVEGPAQALVLIIGRIRNNVVQQAHHEREGLGLVGGDWVVEKQGGLETRPYSAGDSRLAKPLSLQSRNLQ